jgi:hypothetical protein
MRDRSRELTSQIANPRHRAQFVRMGFWCGLFSRGGRSMKTSLVSQLSGALADNVLWSQICFFCRRRDQRSPSSFRT